MSGQKFPDTLNAEVVKAMAAAEIMKYVGVEHDEAARLAAGFLSNALDRVKKAAEVRPATESYETYINRVLEAGYESIAEAFKLGMDVVDLTQGRQSRLGD
jgi:hypothetical protein